MRPVIRLSTLIAVLLLLAACHPVRPSPAEPAGEANATATSVAATLARQLGVDSSEITIVSSEAVEWPDACLGVTHAGEMCAQVITPGHKVILSVGGDTYTYHTDQNAAWVRLAEGPEPQIGERIADWRGLADNGSCLQATFGTAGVAFGGCGGAQTQGHYASAGRLATLQELVATYAPFQAETEWGMLDLAGAGATTASDEEQTALARWAQAATMEAVGGQSFAGMTYEGPAELGQADASHCAAVRIGTEEVTVWACDGTVTTVPLSENLAATWADMAERFGRFIYETPSERLIFEGMGLIDDEIWQRALLAWARVTRAEMATGQSSATARTALSWHLGPVPDTTDVCAHLTVLDYGYAYAEQRACESGELISASEDWLEQAEMQQFDRWLYTFAPLYVEDNYLNGAGLELMPEEETADLQAWAENLWVRLAGMPVAPADSAADPAPASGAAVACDDPAAGAQAYSSAEYRFCLLTPAGYSVVETVPGNFSLVAGGNIMDHISPRVGIEVSATGDRTLAGIAGQMMEDYAPVGTDVTAQASTVDGAEAVLLDNLPGQDLNRRVVVVHNGFVYSLMFMPLNPEAEPFYQSVLESLRFLD